MTYFYGGFTFSHFFLLSLLFFSFPFLASFFINLTGFFFFRLRLTFPGSSLRVGTRPEWGRICSSIRRDFHRPSNVSYNQGVSTGIGSPLDLYVGHSLDHSQIPVWWREIWRRKSHHEKLDPTTSRSVRKARHLINSHPIIFENILRLTHDNIDDLGH